MKRGTRYLVAILVAASVLVPVGTSSAAEHSAEDAVVENPNDGTRIAITIFKPAGAGARAQVPVILHSHGWAGSRATAIGGVIEEFLDAGFGVVSIDQRGDGGSGGQAHVQDPTKETEDIKAVIDHVADLSWVLHDRRDGRAIANDPVLGAIGGSYGGGYQTMTSLDEIRDAGRTRFDALAPEITWYDLPESLAPQKVVRSAWVTALYGAGARMLPEYVHRAFIWGAATGQWPDGTFYGEKNDAVPDIDSEFHKHGPVWFVEKGVRIDVPMLLRQGSSDNLFNLNQGLKIFDRALTPAARDRSLFVAYNGGHALPTALPPGTAAGADACTEDFTQLTIRFFQRSFAGADTSTLLPSRYNLTTADGGTCLHAASLDAAKKIAVDGPAGEIVVLPAGAGAPLHLPLQDGEVSVAGIPLLSGKITTAGLDARVFFGLSVGTTPADARVVQNNLMPLRRALPAQADAFEIELPGVAVDVPQGQSLFLTVTPVSDIYLTHGSRTPSAVQLSDLRVKLPVMNER